MDELRVMSNGAVSVWKKPSIVLMKVHLVETAATIANALSRLKSRVESAKNLLQELNASDVEIGPFVLGELEDSDALSQARIARQAALVARQQSFGRVVRPRPQKDPDVSVFTVASAQWMIPGDNDEERMISVANLRLRLADIGGASNEEQEDPPVWPTPEEQIQSVVEKMSLAAGGKRDHRIPRLYFVTTLGEEDESLALVEAVARARESAERLARATGKTLGEVTYLSQSRSVDHHTATSMKKHTSVDHWPRICDSTFNEVSDDMRAVQFVVNVSAQFFIQRADD